MTGSDAAGPAAAGYRPLLRRSALLVLAGSSGLTAVLLLWCLFRGNPSAQLLKVITGLPNNGLPLLSPGVIIAVLYLVWRRRKSDWCQLGCSFAVWAAFIYSGIFLASDRVSRLACDYHRARITAAVKSLGPEEAARRLAEFRRESPFSRREIESLSRRLAPEDEPNITIGFAGLKFILVAEAAGLALLIVLLILPQTIGRPISQFVLAGALLFFAAAVITQLKSDRRAGDEFDRLVAGIDAQTKK